MRRSSWLPRLRRWPSWRSCGASRTSWSGCRSSGGGTGRARGPHGGHRHARGSADIVAHGHGWRRPTGRGGPPRRRRRLTPRRRGARAARARARLPRAHRRRGPMSAPSWMARLRDPNPVLARELRTTIRAPSFLAVIFLSSAAVAAVTLFAATSLGSDRLPFEAGRGLGAIFAPGDRRGDQLDRHLAAELRVVGAVDRPHRSAPDLVADLVAPDGAGNSVRHGSDSTLGARLRAGRKPPAAPRRRFVPVLYPPRRRFRRLWSQAGSATSSDLLLGNGGLRAAAFFLRCPLDPALQPCAWRSGGPPTSRSNCSR